MPPPHLSKKRRGTASAPVGLPFVVCLVIIGGFVLCLCTTVYLFFKMNGLGHANADNVVDFTRNIVTATRRPSRSPEPAAVPVAVTAAVAADDDTVGSCYSHGTVISSAHRPLSSSNDGYCDCPASGADELRTAACSLALVAQPVFDCGDGTVLYASRVGDGVCDCASGRDEDTTGACQKRANRGYLRGWG